MTPVYSLTQRWSPLATCEPGQDEEVRVHFLAFINENTGECLAKEMTEVALQPIELTHWAVELLPAELPCSPKILLDDPNLLGPLTLYLPDFEVVVTAQAEHRDLFFADLQQRLQYHQTDADYCLIENFGESDALRFYRLAKQYFEAAPWSLFGQQVFLEFRDAEGQNQLLGIYGPESDFIGFCFVENDQAQEPIWGVDFGNIAFVSGADLDLLDRKGLTFEPEHCPWILVQNLPDGLTRVLFEDLLWLFQRIPQIARDRQSIKAGGRHLKLHQTID